jgi:purine-binding chemotaxis protein CheW
MQDSYTTSSTETEEVVSTDLLQLVGFRIENELFGVEILKVKEIDRLMEITKVPNSPDFVEGVINLRGIIIPVVDLRKRFKLHDKGHDEKTRIVVIEVDHQTVGIIVDEVSHVIRIPRNIIEPPPPMVAGIGSEYIQGVGKLEKELLILLDMDRAFSIVEKRQLNEFEAQDT